MGRMGDPKSYGIFFSVDIYHKNMKRKSWNFSEILLWPGKVLSPPPHIRLYTILNFKLMQMKANKFFGQIVKRHRNMYICEKLAKCLYLRVSRKCQLQGMRMELKKNSCCYSVG